MALRTYAFRRVRDDVHQCHVAIIAVEQSVRRLVQQDAVDDIRRLPDVLRRVLHLEEITSDHYNNVTVSKLFSLLLIQMLSLLNNRSPR